MKTWIPVLIFGMFLNAFCIFVIMFPPLKDVLPQHPECSVAGFSPDLTQRQRAFCRDWNKK